MKIFDFFKKKQSVSKEEKIDPLDFFPNKYKISTATCEWGKGGSNSIYSNALFLQWWSYSPKAFDTDYPVWMRYKCEITNPRTKSKEMYKSGYLEKCDFERSLLTYTVNELKSILKNQGLPLKGKKEDLINRICNETDLGRIKIPEVYSISEKGEAYLDKYSEVLLAETYHVYDVSIEEYYSAKMSLPQGTSPNDILWCIFKKNIVLHSNNKNFGLLRCVYQSMAQYCEKEKRFSECEKYYCAVLRYDLSGLGNGNTYSFKDIYIPPAVVLGIRKHKEYYDENEVLAFCQKLYLPRSIADFTTFKKVLSDIFNDELLTPEDYIPKRKRPKESVAADDIWEMSDEEIGKIMDEIDEDLGLNEDVPFEEWFSSLKETEDGKVKYTNPKK